MGQVKDELEKINPKEGIIATLKFYSKFKTEIQNKFIVQKVEGGVKIFKWTLKIILIKLLINNWVYLF